MARTSSSRLHRYDKVYKCKNIKCGIIKNFYGEGNHYPNNCRSCNSNKGLEHIKGEAGRKWWRFEKESTFAIQKESPETLDKEEGNSLLLNRAKRNFKVFLWILLKLESC
jgi:hypothetical protein